jgi:VanZ family protein
VKRSATGPFRRFVLYWVPVITYAALIFALSAQPHPERLLPPFLERLGDKLLHVVEYGVLAVLCYRAFRHAWYRANALTALSLAIVAATVYGVSDEVHQAFVPSRTSDLWDIAADLAGACLGSSLWFLGESRGSRPIKGYQ